MMKWWVGGIALLTGIGIGGWWWNNSELLSPRGKEKEVVERRLEKYDLDSLAMSYKVNKVSKVYKVEMLGEIREVEERRKKTTNDQLSIINFKTEKFRFKSQGKWITGMVNYFPERSSLSPAIIMIRGYADKEGYYTGLGSWKMADELAGQGYVTFSIDFLGFGGSEEEPADIMEARFIKVVNVLDLIESVKQLVWIDKTKIGIWAHSNGGQIALSVLEVSGEKYPTVLWAPMTNPFPQSVLETITDDEGGRYVKQKMDEFLRVYDPRRYAFENYLSWIKAPILIQQGTADEWCRVGWQEELVGKLKGLGKKAELVVYKGDDHNLSKNWEKVAKRSLEFFKDKF